MVYRRAGAVSAAVLRGLRVRGQVAAALFPLPQEDFPESVKKQIFGRASFQGL